MNTLGLNVREWGENAPTDKTALLIHGLAGSSLTWRRFAKDLVQKGYRVIAPDLRGHGRSVRSNNYSLQQWSEDVINMGISPDLMVGHSVGGLIAANIQQTLKASKLVLVDPVFHLPRSEMMLRRIQDGFATVMFSKYANAQRRTAKIKDNDTDWLRVELIGINQWDYRSVRALRPNKAAIVRCLMSDENIFLMRAKGSYILPPRVMKKTFGDNIKLAYFGDGGHNIHIGSYDTFKNDVFEFLTETELDPAAGCSMSLSTPSPITSSIPIIDNSVGRAFTSSIEIVSA